MTWRYQGSAQLRASGIVCLVAIVLAASFLAASAPMSAQSGAKKGYVNTEDERLNLRSGPGTGFPIVAKLEPGAAVMLLVASADGLWVEVQVDGDDVTGWAASEFIAAGDPQPTRSTASLARPEFGPRFIPSAVSRALAGASTGDEDADKSAGTEPIDSPASADDEEAPKFVFPEPTPDPDVIADAIDSADGEGADAEAALEAVDSAPGDEGADEIAVSAPDSAATSPDPQPTRAPRPEPTVPMAITQPDRMNVRSGPGTVYGIVTSVAAGTEMEILALGPQGEWYQVRVSGQEEPAWLFAGLVDAVGPMDSLARVAEEDVPVPPEAAVVAAAPSASSAAVAAAPPPSGAGFFGYGIQAHLLGGQAGSALTSISDLGFNWVKQQVQWKDYQPQPGAVGFGELGGIVSAAQGRGLNVLFSVVNAPQWAREDGFDNSVGGPPADPQTYANFVGAMAGQFCGTSLKAIEIWNEQNLHYEWGNKPLDPAEYMNLLRPAYASIKAACPEMLVISGALTPAASNGAFALDDFTYLEGMYQNGLADYSDGIGAHPSGYNVPASVRWEEACAVIQQTGNSFNGACDTPHHSWAFRSTMEGYRNIMTVYGDTNKRIWPTEFGWAAGGAFDPRYAYANDNGFDEQAAWTVEAYTMMRDWGWVGPAFLWNLNFRVVADGTEKAQWGIVGNDWQPLPTYQALQAMAK